jgi:predicted FMN-binding regulatory protein PaiB
MIQTLVIVAFEIEIQESTTKKKMSQNRETSTIQL